MPCKLYIVAGPSDAAKISQSEIPVIALNYKISNDGCLKKSKLDFKPSSKSDRIMGISDNGLKSIPHDVERLCGDIYFETKNGSFSAVLLDFENSSTEMYPFVSALSYSLHSRDIQHFVSERFYSAAPFADIVTECSAAGGAFKTFYESIVSRFKGKTIAFELFPYAADFKIPSFGRQGNEISQSTLDSLMKKHKPFVFFSDEMLTKYFTYKDEYGDFHFVIFDDSSTLREKLLFLEQNNAYAAFILFSDWLSIN